MKAFEKAYPNIPLSVTTLSSSASNAGLEEKFDLFNKTGSGWPDVIFWPNNDALAWAVDPLHYAANLESVVPKKIQAGYPKAVIAECRVDGGLYCLRNDVAPDILWYNAKLFRQWGYSPPKTWPQYEALGLRIAKQHPGYNVGMLGDTYTVDRYFWSSGCPISDQVSSRTVLINPQLKSCTRVVNMLNTLLKAKALSPAGIFSTAGAIVGKKMVMTPGAAWYGVYLFEDTFKVPAGQMTATMPLEWPGSPNGTGDEGGGLWSMSSHISGQRQADTLKFIEFMATNPAWQVDLTTGLPAYAPDDAAWIKKNIVDSHYFADPSQIGPAMEAGARLIRPGYENLLYSPEVVWTDTVVPALSAGKTLASVAASYWSGLVHQAELEGYRVVKSGT